MNSEYQRVYIGSCRNRSALVIQSVYKQRSDVFEYVSPLLTIFLHIYKLVVRVIYILIVIFTVSSPSVHRAIRMV